MRTILTRRLWRYGLFGIALLGIFGTVALTRGQSPREELDPAKLAPDVQKIVFENALIRVMEERMPPGRGVPKHRHSRGLTIALADYKMEQKMYPGGEVVHSNRRFGEINWTDGLIHEARNVGTTNQYVVRVELK
jgi:hypothetical protein